MSASLNASHVWDPASAQSLVEPMSHDQVRARHKALYEHGIETGLFEAHVLPLCFLHQVLFGLYFVLVPPSWLHAETAGGSAWRRGRRWMLLQAKYPLFLLLVWRTVVVVSECRALAGFVAYLIGISQGFFAWWFAALFIFREPRFDCMRLEREKVALDVSSAAVQRSEARSTGANGNGGSDLHLRSKAATEPERSGTEPAQVLEYRYYWQGLPPTLGHRAAWVLDLVTCLRGAGWAHQVRTLPMPPAEALEKLPASSPRLTAKPTRLGLEGPNARARLLRKCLATFAACYLMFDVFKSVLVLHDPFFWGVMDAPFPPGLLPTILSESPTFVRGLRTFASGTAVVVVIIGVGSGVFTLALLCTAKDNVRAEPWMWADLFGDPRNVLDHGLAGVWGEWWHQVMRISLSAPTEALSAACGWGRRDARTQATATALAFLISGAIHAAGSHTQLGDTQPSKPFLFFVLQGVGILVETLTGLVCHMLGLRLSLGSMRVVRGAWVFAFLAFTGPFFADDMARGGAWLTELLPYSFVRRRSLWREPLMWWHSGRVWWESGLAS